MEPFVTLQEHLEKVLERNGMGSQRVAGELVAEVRYLIKKIRDEESDPVENDFQAGFEAGWDNALESLLVYCDSLVPMDEEGDPAEDILAVAE
jgi:hypothetical protein